MPRWDNGDCGRSVVASVSERLEPPTAVAWAGRSAWRNRPTSVRVLLVVMVVTEGVVSGWNIGHGQYFSFYADAARSMSLSWRALVTGAADPSATITLDKLSGFLVPQVLSVRLFGFHPWSTDLPQVVEGMVTVVAVYVIGARWKGATTGLIAAAAAAVTPLLSSMFGRSSEDALITMAMALAFWCWQSAVRNGRLLPLMLACGWIAVGFQAKMLQSWFIIPALIIGYLLGGREPVRRRLVRAAAATVVTAMLSLTWVIALAVTPAADRPFIDGTTDNNAFTMVFGYNGINRVLPGALPGVIGGPTAPRPAARPVVRSVGRATSPSSAKAVDVPKVGDAASSAKLLLPEYVTQVGWCYPLAAVGLLLSLAPMVGLLRPRRSRSRPGRLSEVARAELGTGVAMAVWLLIDVAFLTGTTIPHVSYLAAVAVQLSVLAAVGLTVTHRWWAAAVPGIRRWAFPGLIAVETGWAALTLHRSQVAPRHLATVVAAGGLLIVAWSVRRDLGVRGHRVVLGASAAVVLLAPAVWTSFNITTAVGAYTDAYGGPSMSRPHLGHPALSEGGQQFRVADPFRASPDPQLSLAQAALIAYLRHKVPADTVLFATDSWREAEPYILDDGLDIMPMGGYSGRAPAPTLAQIIDLVGRHQLRFFLLRSLPEPAATVKGKFVDGVVSPGTVNPSNTFLIRDWVARHCGVVTDTVYETNGRSLAGQTLYACYAIGSK